MDFLIIISETVLCRIDLGNVSNRGHCKLDIVDSILANSDKIFDILNTNKTFSQKSSQWYRTGRADVCLDQGVFRHFRLIFADLYHKT